jgi:hypothetical protein
MTMMTLQESIEKKATLDALIERQIARPVTSASVRADSLRAGMVIHALIGGDGWANDAALRGEAGSDLFGFECRCEPWNVPGASLFEGVL